MNIIKGLTFPKSFDTTNVQINSGSIHHTQMKFDNLDFPFKKNAFIPKNDWRSLNVDEEKLLFDDNYSDCNFMFVGGLSSDIVEMVQDFKIHNLKNRQDVFEKLKSNPNLLERFNEKIENFVSELNQDNEVPEFHRLSVIPSGRYVTSINLNEDDFEYLGLHIDHSTIFNLENAHLSQNRICINIGNEDRFLYVINLSLKQIQQMLSEKTDISQLNVENITDYFFKYFPKYPVLKIKQKPFKYYIAPTDNCIHDGSTYNNNSLDITITFLGKFHA